MGCGNQIWLKPNILCKQEGNKLRRDAGITLLCFCPNAGSSILRCYTTNVFYILVRLWVVVMNWDLHEQKFILSNGICTTSSLGVAMNKRGLCTCNFVYACYSHLAAYLLNHLSMIFVISKQSTTEIIAFFKGFNNNLLKKKTFLKGDELRSPIIAFFTKLHHPSHFRDNISSWVVHFCHTKISYIKWNDAALHWGWRYTFFAQSHNLNENYAYFGMQITIK